MSTSYTDSTKRLKVREPLFKRFRSYYRAPRKSHQENLASDQIYLDIVRLSNELESINVDILNKVKVILDKEKDDNFTTLNDDGSRVFPLDSDLIDSLVFYSNNPETDEYTEIVEVPTIDYLASRLAKVQYRLNRLER